MERDAVLDSDGNIPKSQCPDIRGSRLGRTYGLYFERILIPDVRKEVLPEPENSRLVQLWRETYRFGAPPD